MPGQHHKNKHTQVSESTLNEPHHNLHASTTIAWSTPGRMRCAKIMARPLTLTLLWLLNVHQTPDSSQKPVPTLVTWPNARTKKKSTGIVRYPHVNLVSFFAGDHTTPKIPRSEVHSHAHARRRQPSTWSAIQTRLHSYFSRQQLEALAT